MSSQYFYSIYSIFIAFLKYLILIGPFFGAKLNFFLVAADMIFAFFPLTVTYHKEILKSAEKLLLDRVILQCMVMS